MNKWISIKDKTPNNNEMVAVYVFSEGWSEIELATWDESKQRFEYYDNEHYGMPVHDVSYWMRFPEPPVNK